MNKDEAFKQFNKVLTIRNLAPRTIHTYNSHLNRFLTWADREDVSSIDLPVIQDYVYHLLEIGNSPSDVNVAECTIRYFFEAVLGNRISRLQLPKLKYTEAEPYILSKEEIKEILDTDDPRMKLIILLGLDCGLRASETMHLKIGDVDIKRMTISIRKSKGGKSRLVKMSDTLLEAFRNYAKVYFSLRDWDEDDYVFPGHFKNRKASITQSVLSRWFKEYLQTKSFFEGKNITYHALRHTFATNMLENGCDVFLLKKLLGHSTFASTSRYIHYTTRDIETAFSLSDVMDLNG